MRELYLHIGYPKTGTTTFQDYLFPNHPEIIDISPDIRPLEVLKKLHYSRENSLLRDMGLNRNEIEAQTTITNGKHILSEESFLSYSMFFQSFPRPQIFTPDPASTARKLKIMFLESGLFDSVKIIITIRRQEEMLKSMYAQMFNYSYKRYSETKNFSAFLDYVFKIGHNGFILDALHFLDIIQVYQKQFGEGNVKVLVFEQLKQDPTSFIKQLCDYLEIDATQAMTLLKNKRSNAKSGLDGYKSDTRSLVDYLAYYKRKYLGALKLDLSTWPLVDRLRRINVSGKVLKDIVLTGMDEKRIADMFNESNRELDTKLKLNMDQYGYY